MVDRLPRQPGVLVALGRRRTRYKFASVLGRIMAELGARRGDAVGAASSSAFRIDRPILLEADAGRRPWMV